MNLLIKKNKIIIIFFVCNLLLYLALLLQLSDEFFIFDDNYFIKNNVNINEFNLNKTLKIFQNSLMPIPYTIWGSLGTLIGFESAYHFKVLNLSIHLVNANLVGYFSYIFFKYVFKDRNYLENTFKIISIFSGLFYYLHPAQAEVIAWASSLKDVLSTFFYLLTVCIYFKNRQNLNSPLWIILSTLVILALLTKPNTITIIPFLFLLDLMVFKNKISQYFILLIPVMIGFVFLHIQRSGVNIPGKLEMMTIASLSDWLFSIFTTLGIYFKIAVFPIPIYFFTYSKSKIAELNYIAFLTISSIISIILIHIRVQKISIIIFLLLSFTLLISPNTGILNNYFQENFSIISSRYFNLPLVFMTLLCARFLFELINYNRKIVIGMISILLMTFYFSMFQQLNLWKKSSSLLLYSTSHSKPTSELYTALATAYQKEGYNDLAQYWSQKAMVLKENKP